MLGQVSACPSPFFGFLPQVLESSSIALKQAVQSYHPDEVHPGKKTYAARSSSVTSAFFSSTFAIFWDAVDGENCF
jgi:hypothetical protein